MDENIGRLVKTLKQLDLEENTIIVFTSDNGGFSTYNKYLYPFLSLLQATPPIGRKRLSLREALKTLSY